MEDFFLMFFDLRIVFDWLQKRSSESTWSWKKRWEKKLQFSRFMCRRYPVNKSLQSDFFFPPFERLETLRPLANVRKRRKEHKKYFSFHNLTRIIIVSSCILWSILATILVVRKLNWKFLSHWEATKVKLDNNWDSNSHGWAIESLEILEILHNL